MAAFCIWYFFIRGRWPKNDKAMAEVEAIEVLVGPLITEGETITIALEGDEGKIVRPIRNGGHRAHAHYLDVSRKVAPRSQGDLEPGPGEARRENGDDQYVKKPHL